MAPDTVHALLGSNGAGRTTAIRILSTPLRADGGRAAVLTGPARGAGTYSGGMRRRLDIAMSLVGDPSVLFLDEPTSGLDPEARMEVWRTVRDLAAQGTTILLTTQHLEEAEQLADRISILHGGRIIVEGTLAELKALLPPALLLFVYVFGSAIDTDTGPEVSYVEYLLPGILLITVASGVAWAHVLTSLVANLVSLALVVLVAVAMGSRSGAGLLAWLGVLGIMAVFTLTLTWRAVVAGLAARSTDGARGGHPLLFLPFLSSARARPLRLPQVRRHRGRGGGRSDRAPPARRDP